MDMKKWKDLSDRINTTVSYTGLVFFVILIIACVSQVFFRFVLNHSLSWTEELARYAFIWMHLLGASLLITGSGHATVTVILDAMGGGLKKAFRLLIELVILFDGAVMAYSGVMLSWLSRANESTALSIPMYLINISVAVGGLLLMFQAVAAMVLIMGDYQVEEEKPVL